MKQIPVVIAVILNSEEKILIAKRNDPEIPEAHGKWELVGGKIDYGEDPEKALVREVLEETGLVVKNPKLLPRIFQNKWTKKDGSEFQVILIPYLCKSDDTEPKISDPKISELKYVSSEEVAGLNFLKVDKEIIDLAFQQN